MKRHVILALVATVAVAACGDLGSDDGAPATTVPPIDPEQRILEVRYEGGFAPVELLFSQPPRYTLYGDGRLVYEGPVAAIYPGPLMSNLQVAEIGDDGMTQVMAAINVANLPNIIEETNTDAAEFVADAPTTVITYTDENGDHIYRVYALGITDDDPELNNLLRVVETLDGLAASATSTSDYPVERIQVIVTESFNTDDPEATIEPWPLKTAPGDVPDFVVDLKCIVLDGPAAAAALPVFESADQLTFFEDQGTAYRLTVRPLLEGEPGCRAE
jgi:hypothetical protein